MRADSLQAPPPFGTMDGFSSEERTSPRRSRSRRRHFEFARGGVAH
jgi:hypothetical protein